PQCSSCHASMAHEPLILAESPPADLILAQTTPCFQYGRVLEEWYYVEELFVTIEHHLTELEEDRYHVEPFIEELTGSRDFYREVKNKPVVSLANFVLDMGKLRFDVGKVYRPVKERRIDQKNRDMLGVFILGTIVLLFFVVTGWRIASGNGIVNPTLTKLGYEALKEKEAKEKEISE
ncbi:hypothetical protein ACFL5L_02695, partial [candidate division KSB1 bacterium]